MAQAASQQSRLWPNSRLIHVGFVENKEAPECVVSITHLNERQKGQKTGERKEARETDERKEERSHLLTFIVEPCIDKSIISSNQLMHVLLKTH